MNTLSTTNEVVALVVRALETGDSRLLGQAQDAMPRTNDMDRFFDEEVNELVENLNQLILAANEHI